MIALLGMSEKSRKVSFRFQTGPSTHLCPSTSFSTLAPAGTSLSKAGSRLTILAAESDSVAAEFVVGLSSEALLAIGALEQKARTTAKAATIKDMCWDLFIYISCAFISPVHFDGI